MAWVAAAIVVAALTALDKSSAARNDARFDAGLFFAAGRLWAEGALPYRDFWDNKPPGIFFVDSIVARAGGGFGALAIVEACAAAITALFFFLLCRRVLREWTCWIGVLLFGLYANQFAFTEGGNLTETYLILPETAAAWLAVGALRRKSTALMAGAGALAACAAIFKPVGLAVAIAASGAMLIETLRAEDSAARRAIAKMFAGLCLGVAAGLAPWVAWAAARGILAEMWNASIAYNMSYVANTSGGWIAQIRRAAFLLGRMAPMWIGVAVLIAFNLARLNVARTPLPVMIAGEDARAVHRSGIGAFALLWLLMDLFGALAGGYAYGHYFLPCVPSLAFAGLLGLEALWGPASPRWRRPARVAVIASLLAWFPLLALQIRHTLKARERSSRYAQEDAALAREVASLAPPGAAILVWGHDFVIHARYGYAIPNRTLSLAHLSKSPRAAEWVRPELEALFASNPPAVIVEPLVPRENLLPLDPTFRAGGSTQWRGQIEIVDWLRRTLADQYAPPARFKKGNRSANLYARKR